MKIKPFTGWVKKLQENTLWRVDFGSIYFRVLARTVQRQKFDGSESDPFRYIVFDRGNSVSALIHLEDINKIVLVRQFRGGTDMYELELPAGMRDGEEEAEEAIVREIAEETGFVPSSILKLFHLCTSPGASSEEADIFYARCKSVNRKGDGGGRIEESEDIEVHLVSIEDAIRMVREGEIRSATTVAAIQWLENKRLQELA